jgi:predicted HicB family RNase H-like nuclease
LSLSTLAPTPAHEFHHVGSLPEALRDGGADFYAQDLDGLRREGEISLRVFLDACAERGIEPRKSYSGKFNVRVPPDLHGAIVAAASANGKSLNQWVVDTLHFAQPTPGADQVLSSTLERPVISSSPRSI